MGASDELFRGFLQLLIANLEDVLAERDPEKRQAQLERQEQQAPPRVNLYKLRKERESELRRMRAALKRLEGEIEAADARRGELEERLGSPEVSADYEELTRVTGELTELDSKSEELLMEWTELSVELERQEAESEG